MAREPRRRTYWGFQMSGHSGRGLRPSKSSFSRRGLLGGGAGLGALLWVPRLARAADPHQEHMSPTLGIVPRTAPAAMDAPLVEPEVRRSANGVLQTSLRCAYTYRDVGGVRLYVRTYEGGAPGPTLRMKPGETLKIRLANDFPAEPRPGAGGHQ